MTPPAWSSATWRTARSAADPRMWSSTRPSALSSRPGRRTEPPGCCADPATHRFDSGSSTPVAEPLMTDPLITDPPVSYTHLRAHETRHDLVCRLLLEK